LTTLRADTAASALSFRLRLAPRCDDDAAVSGGLGGGCGAGEGEESALAGTIGPPGFQPGGGPEAIGSKGQRI
jgi:hypothetical protein